LSSAYTEILSSANGKVILDANGQQEFIDFLGFSTCSGGGESIVPIALIQVTNTTATMTTTHSNVPLAAAMATLTIAPVSLQILKLKNNSPYLGPAPSMGPIVVLFDHLLSTSAYRVSSC